MLYLTRKERFNAAHRMFNPDWTDEMNLEVYGKCSNPNWHGHNYVLYVTVCGETDPASGLVVNLKDLSEMIRQEVIEPLDHRNMNLEVPFMQGKLASTENLAQAIWDVLESPVRALGVDLYRIRIEETENNIVEYYGK